jgi:hypothetical protein
VVEHLPSEHKALSSKSQYTHTYIHTQKKKKGRNLDQKIKEDIEANREALSIPIKRL